ncbi:MAG: hypothetical protein ACLVJ6_17510 [Merdibacter sp.]
MLATQPQKLSQNEFHLAAQEYEPGTDEFSEVYETAVRMYPADGWPTSMPPTPPAPRDRQSGRYLSWEDRQAVYARVRRLSAKDYDVHASARRKHSPKNRQHHIDDSTTTS